MGEELPVLFATDVLVVGGGPAGMCAAISAARCGAEVAIVERWPMLGGQSTMARVCIWHTSDLTREVIHGLTQEFVERLEVYGGIQRRPDFPRRHETYDFNAEWMIFVYEDFVRELGIRVLCNTPCVAVRTEAREIREAVVGTKQGLRAIRAGRFIDATGDADLAFFAGCRTYVGRESDGKVQGMTLVSSFTGFDNARLDSNKPEKEKALERMRELRDRGGLPQFGGVGLGESKTMAWHGGLIACTLGDPLDNEDLTRATMAARAKLPKLIDFFRENVPGCEHMELRWTAPALGVRESRRVKGLYEFGASDVEGLSSFRDAIGHGFWMIDIHDPEGSGYTTWNDKSIHLEPGTTYQIPYRILVPEDVDNLLVAGRCASATHEGMAALRIQSHCHIMGQAAGTAAAVSLRTDSRPADVVVDELQVQLAADGVWIDRDRARSA